MVILGTGVSPNTELFKSSLSIAEDGGLKADAFLKTSSENIFCAGDVCSYPYWYNATRGRNEHYSEAV